MTAAPRVPAEVLAAELKAARRGRGLYHAGIAGRIGPAMRATFGILDTDAPAEARIKVIRRVQEGSRGLPEELQLAVLGALGIHKDVRDLMLLQDRVGWLAGKLRRDTRTARRRIDEGCDRLAEILVAGTDPRRTGRPGGRDGWYVQTHHAIVVLDSGPPMIIERRVVVAERDGLAELTLQWTVPRVSTSDDHDVHVRALYGGEVVGKERASDSRFRLVLTLPRALRAGETHAYGVLVQIPPDQAMRTHYVYVPATRCDFFDLRVRFGRSAPARVWRIADAFHRDLDEFLLDADVIPVDPVGEVHLTFTEMAVGHGYGVQWGGPGRATP